MLKISTVFGPDAMGSPSNKPDDDKTGAFSQLAGIRGPRGGNFGVPNHSRIFAANGQLSPVSGRSLAFTENDQKFSLGSYVPSHLSSYTGARGAPNPAVYEIGQVRGSLLNFA